MGDDIKSRLDRLERKISWIGFAVLWVAVIVTFTYFVRESPTLAGLPEVWRRAIAGLAIVIGAWLVWRKFKRL